MLIFSLCDASVVFLRRVLGRSGQEKEGYASWGVKVVIILPTHAHTHKYVHTHAHTPIHTLTHTHSLTSPLSKNTNLFNLLLKF